MIPLKTSCFATVLILVIWGIRRLTLNRLPKNTFCVLWICAALRLVIPFSIPSRFSVFNLFLMPQPASEVPVHQMMSAVKTEPRITPLTLVWLAGALALAAFFLVSYIRAMVLFRRAVPMEALPEGTPKFLRRVQVKKSGRITGPLTYGVFRPVILLPDTTDWDNTEALSFVLAHEYAHIRRWDCLTKLLMAAALCLHWFNPAVWLLCRFAGRDMELACDEKAIRTLGEENRFSYARVLTEQGCRGHGIFLPASTFGGAKIKERIDAILKSHRRSWVALVISIVLVIVTLAVFATGAKVPEYLPPAKTAAQPDYSDWTSACPDDARLYYIESEVLEKDPVTGSPYRTPVLSLDVVWLLEKGNLYSTGVFADCTPDGSVSLSRERALIPLSEFSCTRFHSGEAFIESFSPEYRQAVSDLLRFSAENCADHFSEDAFSDPSLFTKLTTVVVDKENTD